jgi:hypothetical protein
MIDVLLGDNSRELHSYLGYAEIVHESRSPGVSIGPVMAAGARSPRRVPRVTARVVARVDVRPLRGGFTMDASSPWGQLAQADPRDVRRLNASTNRWLHSRVG